MINSPHQLLEHLLALKYIICIKNVTAHIQVYNKIFIQNLSATLYFDKKCYGLTTSTHTNKSLRSLSLKIIKNLQNMRTLTKNNCKKISV